MVRRRQPPVHVDDVGLGHAELVGDLGHILGRQIAFVERLEPGLELAQVEEQLLLGRRGAHLDQRPGMQDVFLDRAARIHHIA